MQVVTTPNRLLSVVPGSVIGSGVELTANAVVVGVGVEWVVFIVLWVGLCVDGNGVEVLTPTEVVLMLVEGMVIDVVGEVCTSIVGVVEGEVCTSIVGVGDNVETGVIVGGVGVGVVGGVV